MSQAEIWTCIFGAIAAVATLFTAIGVPTIFPRIYDRHIKKKDHERDLVKKTDLAGILDPIVATLNQVATDVKDTKKELKETRADLDKVKSEVVIISETTQKTKEGLQSELRLTIREECYKCIDQGFRTDEDSKAVIDAYEKYEGLGANGVTKDLYEQFKALPIKIKR